MSTPEERRATAAAQAEHLALVKDDLILGEGLAGRSERLETIGEFFDQAEVARPTAAQVNAERTRRMRPIARQQSKDNLAGYLRRRAKTNPYPDGAA